MTPPIDPEKVSLSNLDNPGHVTLSTYVNFFIFFSCTDSHSGPGTANKSGNQLTITMKSARNPQPPLKVGVLHASWKFLKKKLKFFLPFLEADTSSLKTSGCMKFINCLCGVDPAAEAQAKLDQGPQLSPEEEAVAAAKFLDEARFWKM